MQCQSLFEAILYEGLYKGDPCSLLSLLLQQTINEKEKSAPHLHLWLSRHLEQLLSTRNRSDVASCRIFVTKLQHHDAKVHKKAFYVKAIHRWTEILKFVTSKCYRIRKKMYIFLQLFGMKSAFHFLSCFNLIFRQNSFTQIGHSVAGLTLKDIWLLQL